jgi:hypothetical protein
MKVFQILLKDFKILVFITPILGLGIAKERDVVSSEFSLYSSYINNSGTGGTM